MKGIAPTRTTRLVPVLLTAAVYLVAARLGLLLAFQHTNVSPVWPPTGVALAAVLVAGSRVWPGITIGAFLANYTTGLSFPVAAFISAGNTLEAIFGGYLVRRFTQNEDPFETASNAFKFLLACCLCTIVSATIGTSAVHFGGFSLGASFLYLWWNWWVGDTVGAIVITPLIYSWSKKLSFPWSSRRFLEAFALLLLLLVVGFIVFGGWFRIGGPLVYATVPLVVWAAFRFQQRGASGSIFLLSTIAVLGTTKGHGPFYEESLNESLLILQTFMGVVAATALPVAAVVTERKRAEENNLLQLKEKEVLLQEIHHRVKNNLQIIASLLSMQLDQAEPSVRAMLQESRNRIYSMAMIHERLYQTDNLSRINLGPYLKELVAHICSSYGADNSGIVVEVDCQDAIVEIDKAVPTGLIVNEIVTNSFKHAFPDNRQGKVSVQARSRAGRTLLELSDTGRGLPEEIDLDQTKTLGLKVVFLLIRQLRASVRVERSSGTRFQIEFE